MGIEQHKPRSRGIIVVDANMLEEMAIAYDKTKPITPRSPIASLKPYTGTYLDILPILARQGYEILIPETVIFEAGKLLVGKDVNKHFITNKRQYDTQPSVRSFLQNVLAKRFQNIEVIEADISGINDLRAKAELDPATADLLYYPQELAKAKIPDAQNYQHYISDLRAALGKGDPDRLRRAIQELREKHKESKRDMGENHCFDVIEEEIARQHFSDQKVPIFFLSADGKAREALNKRIAAHHVKGDPKVSVLTSGGVYVALEADPKEAKKKMKSNAFNLMGFHGNVEEHWKHIYAICSQQEDNMTPKTAAREDGYEDAPVGQYNTGNHPFMDSAQGIGKELEMELMQAVMRTHAAEQKTIKRAEAGTPAGGGNPGTGGR